jgi:GWxTD domain-containing protein
VHQGSFAMIRIVKYFSLFIFIVINTSFSQEIFKNEKQRQHVFRLILPNELLEVYDQIIVPLEKQKWENKYWRIFDPTPTTEKNEFYEEFISRFEIAKKHFSNIISPLFIDDRGKYYIKYGEPDDKTVSVGIGENYRDNETWAYYEKSLYIDFVDQTGFGFREVNNLMQAVTSGSANTKIQTAAELYIERESLHQMYSRFRDVLNGSLGFASESAFYRLTEDIASERKLIVDTTQPVSFSYSYSKEKLDAKISSSVFRGEDGLSRVEFYYAFPMKQLTFREGTQIPFESLVKKELTIFNQKFEKVAHKDETLKLFANTQNQIEKRFYINQHNEELAPGNYNVALKLDNATGNSLAILRGQLLVKDFSADTLMLSDIQFSSQIREDITGTKNLKPNNIQVVPYIGHTINKQRPLYIYFEIYNLFLKKRNETKFRIRYEVSSRTDLQESTLSSALKFISRLVGKEKTKETIGTSFESEGVQEFQQIYLSIDFSVFSNGPSKLIIWVTDLGNGKSNSAQRRFVLK